MVKIQKKRIFQCFGLLIIIVAVVFVGALQLVTMDRAFQEIEEKDGLIIIYHPGRYDKDADWYNSLYDEYRDTMIGLEVYNQGDRYKEDRILWDEINKVRAPNDLVWGFSNDDWHRPEHSFRSYQHMLMEDLTESDLRIAMKTGALYFSYEPDGNDNESIFYGKAMTPKIENITVDNTIIIINGLNYDNITWYNDLTEEIHDIITMNVSHFQSNFVRAVLENEYGRTYTQPFGYNNSEIFNPYSEVNWTIFGHYKANFHTHTTESDGRESPDEVIYRFHEAEYNILALTDHNRNSWPWSNWIDEEPEVESKTSEYYPELNMLAISGNEPSDSHHFGSYFNDYSGTATDLKFQLSRL